MQKAKQRYEINAACLHCGLVPEVIEAACLVVDGVFMSFVVAVALVVVVGGVFISFVLVAVALVVVFLGGGFNLPL